MASVYLTAEEALHALADGKVLENDDGAEVVLEGNFVILRYTMGKNNMIVTQNYNAGFGELFLAEMAGQPENPEESEEENASE